MNKPKTHICKSCEGNIVNRQANAIYCSKCSKDIGDIERLILIKLFNIRQKYPNYKIKFSLNINRKTRGENYAMRN